MKSIFKEPKILIFDIETSPIITYNWGLFDQTAGINQMVEDWFIMSWAAKWLGDDESKIMYADQSKLKGDAMRDDSKMLKGIWKLLDEADIVITMNGDKFDIKKLNTRFIQHGMKKPSKFRSIDLYKEAKKSFAFTSNKLEFLANKLNKKYKKLKHEKYAGFSMWKECLAGNKDAWKHMEIYNKFDVLVTEETYEAMKTWIEKIDFSVFYGRPTCSCGSTHFRSNGKRFTNAGIFQRVRCSSCGKEHLRKENLVDTKTKKKFLKA